MEHSITKLVVKVILIITSALLGGINLSWANPEGGVVVAGEAEITKLVDHLVIDQFSEKAIIDWRTFDIAAHEHTEFRQPNVNAIALNRVITLEPTMIDGRLTANGKVIIINQNGILFGKNAKVDVNALIATTTNMSNKHFMQYENEPNKFMQFHISGKATSQIINKGEIKAYGLVNLVAPQIINQGLITATVGKVHLGSGNLFYMDFYGDQLIKVVVEDHLLQQFIHNSGEIQAVGGKIELTIAAGRTIVNNLIRHTGSLVATSVAESQGEIIIFNEGDNAVINNIADHKYKKSGSSKVYISGLLNSSGIKPGERGGRVIITGDEIQLQEGAVINTSGHTGKDQTTIFGERFVSRPLAAGGEILIGGNYLGKGKIPTAKDLYVDPMAMFINDAIDSGDAGRTIFWADHSTKFYGTVFARALGGQEIEVGLENPAIGGNLGDGGFVEISGKNSLEQRGHVVLSASNGAMGTCLLDPVELTIRGEADLGFDLVGDLQLQADLINLDLQQQTVNFIDNRNVTINTKALQILSPGTLHTKRITDGGNINIIVTEQGVDLTNCLLHAEQGKLSIVTNGPTMLGNMQAGSILVETRGIRSDLTIANDYHLTVSDDINPLILITTGNFKNSHTIDSNPFILTGNTSTARWMIFVDNTIYNEGVSSTYLGNYTESLATYDHNNLPQGTNNLLLHARELGTLNGHYVDSPYVGTNKPITFTDLELFGLDASNYTLDHTYFETQGDLEVKNVQVSFNLANPVVKPYDGTTDADLNQGNYTVPGIFEVDRPKVNLSNFTTGVYDTKDAGQGKLVSVTGLLLTGELKDNYHLENPDPSDYVGIIQKLELNEDNIRLVGESKRDYDRSTDAPLNQANYGLYNIVSINGVLDDLDLTNTPEHGEYDDRHVGRNKLVTVKTSSLGLSGTASGNYKLPARELIITGNIGTIDPKELTISFSDTIQHPYDGTTNMVLIKGVDFALQGVEEHDDVVSFND